MSIRFILPTMAVWQPVVQRVDNRSIIVNPPQKVGKKREYEIYRRAAEVLLHADLGYYQMETIVWIGYNSWDKELYNVIVIVKQGGYRPFPEKWFLWPNFFWQLPVEVEQAAESRQMVRSTSLRTPAHFSTIVSNICHQVFSYIKINKLTNLEVTLVQNSAQLLTHRGTVWSYKRN